MNRDDVVTVLMTLAFILMGAAVAAAYITTGAPQ